MGEDRGRRRPGRAVRVGAWIWARVRPQCPRSRRTGRTSGRLEALAAFPRSPGLAERGIKDGVGGLYLKMLTRGELIQTGERAVDIGDLLTAALDRFGRPDALACDRWREAELRDALGRAGVPPATLIVRGQGIPGRRRGRARLSPRGTLEGTGYAGCKPAVALRCRRGARDHGPGRQLETCQEP